MILSQLLRGMGERMREGGEGGVDAKIIADALAHAAELARRAVVRPVEGTILTVASAAAEGAADALGGPDPGLLGVVEHAHAAASEALARTPEQLEVLARAGVVDAGGTGYLLLLDALLSVIDGRPLPEPSETPVEVDLSALAEDLARSGEDGYGGEAEVGDLRYEVMYFLYAPDDSIADFKEVWAGIGDSIVVVGGEGVWNCHIHTDDIGAAIEAGVDAGRPQRIRVTDLAEQVEEERWVREVWARSGQDRAKPRAVRTAHQCGGGRLRRRHRPHLHSLGVHHQVVGGQSMNPSTAELVAAVEAVGSGDVVILPNNKNIRPVAEQVDALCTKSVQVVRTGSIVEGFAALLAYDPAADAAVNVANMGESAAPWYRRRSPGPCATARPRPVRCTRGTGLRIAMGDRHCRFGRDGDPALAQPPARTAPRADHPHRR